MEKVQKSPKKSQKKTSQNVPKKLSAADEVSADFFAESIDAAILIAVAPPPPHPRGRGAAETEADWELEAAFGDAADAADVRAEHAMAKELAVMDSPACRPPLPVLLARRRTLVYCKSKWRCESRFVETACGSRVERPTHKLSKLH